MSVLKQWQLIESLANIALWAKILWIVVDIFLLPLKIFNTHWASVSEAAQVTNKKPSWALEGSTAVSLWGQVLNKCMKWMKWMSWWWCEAAKRSCCDMKSLLHRECCSSALAGGSWRGFHCILETFTELLIFNLYSSLKKINYLLLVQGTENSVLEFVEIREVFYSWHFWYVGLQTQFQGLPKENCHAIKYMRVKTEQQERHWKLNIWLEILRILFLSALGLFWADADGDSFYDMFSPFLPPNWTVISWCRRSCHLGWFVFVVLECLWIPGWAPWTPCISGAQEWMPVTYFKVLSFIPCSGSSHLAKGKEMPSVYSGFFEFLERRIV